MTPAAGTAVRAEAVARTFARRAGGEVRAVEDVSIDVPAGSFVAITGPSGCGKSTLLSLLGALDRPSAGSVLHDGAPLGSASDAELALLRRRTGFVLQGAPMLRGLCLWENVTQSLVPSGVASRDRRGLAERELARLGLDGFAERLPEELSDGERQRVAVARALVVRPALLVADEPTTHLDADSARWVIEGLLAARASGATVIAATHDPAVAGVADAVHAMRAGRLVAR